MSPSCVVPYREDRSGQHAVLTLLGLDEGRLDAGEMLRDERRGGGRRRREKVGEGEGGAGDSVIGHCCCTPFRKSVSFFFVRF